MRTKQKHTKYAIPRKWKNDPMSPKQYELLRKLAYEKQISFDVNMNKGEAAEMISKLLGKH